MITKKDKLLQESLRIRLILEQNYDDASIQSWDGSSGPFHAIESSVIGPRSIKALMSYHYVTFQDNHLVCGPK